MVYTGERPPQMYWTKFEQQLNTAFAKYVKLVGRIVHLDIMKLTHLMTKVKCDSLNAVTAALTVDIQGILTIPMQWHLKSTKQRL